MTNTRLRSLSDAPSTAPGRTWTPTSRTSFGPPLSLGSLIPHEYRSAEPLWMPLFATASDDVKMSFAPAPFCGGFTFVNAPGVPAVTFDRPRGTTMYGTASGCALDGALASGVATMSPRAVTMLPKFDVSALGRAATAAAEIDRLT